MTYYQMNCGLIKKVKEVEVEKEGAVLLTLNSGKVYRIVPSRVKRVVQADGNIMYYQKELKNKAIKHVLPRKKVQKRLFDKYEQSERAEGYAVSDALKAIRNHTVAIASKNYSNHYEKQGSIFSDVLNF